ncbi:MAG TPA: histidine kinase [Roseiarcus sp.]|jgi:two-component system sensor histidine kinase UhpB
MWPSISLRNRLNLIFASLFALWLVADAIHDVWQASGRSRAETQSAMRVTRDFVTTTLALSTEAPEPEVVKNLVASLQHLRHVRAGIGDPSLASSILSEANKESEAPRWFRALAGAPAETAVIPVTLKNGGTESIVLVADPADEIDEVWGEARENALEGGLLALVAMGVTSLLIGRAVKPLGVAGATLAKLEAGDYSARAERDGPPEIRNLNAKINSLADTLEGLNRANDALMERVFEAHDEERQLIAHELHDEFGPHLFALRASAAVLAKTVGDQPAARAAASAIEAQVGELQGQNRRILADLRPAALQELGLAEALEALVAHWRRAEPKMALTLEVDPRVETLSERAGLMAYRFVQEAMTNAFRHAGATRIEASLKFEAAVETPGLRDPALAGLVIRVADDGRGLQGEAEPGMGLVGMRDRVRLMGGSVSIESPRAGGVVLEARFATARPAPEQEYFPTYVGSRRGRPSNH